MKRLLRRGTPAPETAPAPEPELAPQPVPASESALSLPPALAATLRLRTAGLHEFFTHGNDDPRRPFRCLRALPREAVLLPAMPIGGRMLGSMEVRETPTSWRNPSYLSVDAFVFEARGVVLHGSAGILGASGMVLTDSLMHTDPARHRYRTDGADTVLAFEELRPLPGTHISLLTSASDNYFHAMFDSLARLSMITEADLASADSILIPADSRVDEMLAHYPLPPDLAVRRVAPGETFLVDHLVLPHSLHCVIHYHPVILKAFDAVSARIPADGAERPRRIYVDRRGAGARPMANEEAVVAALRSFGFEPVRLETFAFADQVRLFREAECIVAPHGAGLTNLVFARSRCRVIELGIDAYLHEAFRRVAALRGVSYDCVIGRTRQPWPAPHAFHEMAWEAPLDDLNAAVTRALGQGRTAS